MARSGTAGPGSAQRWATSVQQEYACESRSLCSMGSTSSTPSDPTRYCATPIRWAPTPAGTWPWSARTAPARSLPPMGCGSASPTVSATPTPCSRPAVAGLTSGRRVTTHHDALDDLRGALHITDPHRQRRADLDRQRPSPAASSPRPLDKPPPVPHGRMRTPTTQRSDATPPVDTSRSKSLLPNRRPTSSGSHALNTALSRCCQTLLATVTTATGRSTACHRDTTAGGSSAVAAAQSARVVVSRWYPNGSCRRGDLNPHVLADTSLDISRSHVV